jgi:galactose oxidase
LIDILRHKMLRTWLSAILLAASVASVTITVDSFQAGNEGTKAIDGNTSTFWHSQYSPTLASLPHNAVLDLGSSKLVNGISYFPRQDGNNHGVIGQYKVETSTDQTTWTTVASGVSNNPKTFWHLLRLGDRPG